MPNKPIKQGYKLFGIAEHGYIWSFSWSSRQLGIEEMFRYPTLSPTGSMVMNMISQLPNLVFATPDRLSNLIISNPQHGHGHGNTTGYNQLEIATTTAVASYSIYMDNYFTSVPLFKELYDLGYGACGTARPNTCGIPKILMELRNHHPKSFSWGTLFAVPQQEVLCLAWQDNNLVLGLSTLHSPDTFVNRERKRPAKTSTNAMVV